MDGVDVSQPFNSASLAVPSPTASHIAFLSNARLQIRSLSNFEITRSIALPSSHNLRNTRIAWSPPVLPPTSRPSSASTPPRRSSRLPQPRSNRVLVTDDDTTRVYDLRDEKWNAVISNGSGGMGKAAHADFGATEDEVLIWTEFCAGVKAWCLRSGRSVEIRDPKFIGRDGRGWGVRPLNDTRAGRAGRAGKGGVVALLCRSAGVDILMILAPRTYSVLNRVELPTTDAAGMKWSRDGRWLAVWDAASAGYKLFIYTADGHLYRTIMREPATEDDIKANEHAIEGLGIKSVEWVPGNKYLAIGGWDKRVRILSARTFAPVVFLDHTALINVPSAPVYTECVDGQGNRTYSLTPQPTTPPKAPLEKNETALMKQGISLLAFNADGTLCATREDASPSTVWIWDLQSLKPSIICIQHAPVKRLLWHPHSPSRLLIQTAQDAPTLYSYTATLSSPSPSLFTSTALVNTTTIPPPHSHSHSHSLPLPPTILPLAPHLGNPSSSFSSSSSTTNPKHTPTLSWLSTASHKKPLFMLAHNTAHMLVWPAGKDQILRFERGRESGDGGESDTIGGHDAVAGTGAGASVHSDSDDSLFEILTGRKSAAVSVPRFSRDGVEGVDDDDEEEEDEGVDDTFVGRGGAAAVASEEFTQYEQNTSTSMGLGLRSSTSADVSGYEYQDGYQDGYGYEYSRTGSGSGSGTATANNHAHTAALGESGLDEMF